jgi:hypothetical protein
MGISESMGLKMTHGVPEPCGYISQAHPPTVTRAKRSGRAGDHDLPVALSPLVTPSKPAVWTHRACSGRLPWLLPLTTAYSHSRRLWPRRHPDTQHLAQRPDVIGQARGPPARSTPPPRATGSPPTAAVARRRWASAGRRWQAAGPRRRAQTGRGPRGGAHCEGLAERTFLHGGHAHTSHGRGLR